MELHTWAEGAWSLVGDITGAAGPSAGKKMYMGKEYDFVFDVDVDDNRPQLKLPYNKDEDPWMAAQKFIHANDLPQSYLDQIANFVTRNAPGAGTTSAAASAAGDPLTGCSPSSSPHSCSDLSLTGDRYIPGSAPNGSSGGAGFADPYTGEGRYIPGGGQANGCGGGGSDPYTGGGRYVPSADAAPFVPVANQAKGTRLMIGGPGSESGSFADPLRPLGELIPLRSFILFESVSKEKLLESLTANNGDPGLPEGSRLQDGTFEQLPLSLPHLSPFDRGAGKSRPPLVRCQVGGGERAGPQVPRDPFQLAQPYPLSSPLPFALESEGILAEFLVPALDTFRKALLNQSVAEHFLSVDKLGPMVWERVFNRLLEAQEKANAPIQVQHTCFPSPWSLV